MEHIVKYSCEALAGATVNCIIEDGKQKVPWFKAIDVASALNCKHTDKAVRTHVSEDDKCLQGSLISNPAKSPGLKGNWKSTIYINESGLYCLIFGSEMEEAKVFKRWVTQEVLPQIRETGSYNRNYHYRRNETDLGPTPQQRWTEVNRLSEGREDALHYKVVKHIIKNNTQM